MDPATGEAVAHVGWAATQDMRAAIDAAEGAFPLWRGTLACERGNALRRWASAMRRKKTQLAQIIVLEQGKPLAEAEAEVLYAAGFKQSGLGREGSRHGIQEYMELKYVCVGDLAG
nr:aldehyde dehydrogenase family protein [Parapusillimonas granuli]